MSYRRVALPALLALSACAASIPPVEVTRFHLGSDVERGPAASVAAGNTLESASWSTAVGRELDRLGFRAADNTASRYVYSVEVQRDTREALARRSPISIGIGGGTGGYRSGVGLGASFGIGGNRSRETVVTRMSVQLRDRASQSVVWEGRAETQAPDNSPAAQPGIAADKLAAALFRDFPGVSGRTISVP